MIKKDVYFKEVISEEYKNVFDFYVNHLQFQYITGHENHINHCLNELDARGESYTVIETLKCGSDHILYIDGGVS